MRRDEGRRERGEKRGGLLFVLGLCLGRITGRIYKKGTVQVSVEPGTVPGNTLIKAVRADPEKICVLIKAVFCRNTLCIARKSDEISAYIFRKMPKAICSVFP